MGQPGGLGGREASWGGVSKLTPAGKSETARPRETGAGQAGLAERTLREQRRDSRWRGECVTPRLPTTGCRRTRVCSRGWDGSEDSRVPPRGARRTRGSRLPDSQGFRVALCERGAAHQTRRQVQQSDPRGQAAADRALGWWCFRMSRSEPRGAAEAGAQVSCQEMGQEAERWEFVSWCSWFFL